MSYFYQEIHFGILFLKQLKKNYMTSIHFLSFIENLVKFLYLHFCENFLLENERKI